MNFQLKMEPLNPDSSRYVLETTTSKEAKEANLNCISCLNINFFDDLNMDHHNQIITIDSKHQEIFFYQMFDRIFTTN